MRTQLHRQLPSNIDHHPTTPIAHNPMTSMTIDNNPTTLTTTQQHQQQPSDINKNNQLCATSCTEYPPALQLCRLANLVLDSEQTGQGPPRDFKFSNYQRPGKICLRSYTISKSFSGWLLCYGSPKFCVWYRYNINWLISILMLLKCMPATSN